MERCHRVVVRNTFLSVVPGVGGDASWRSSRSAGPRPKADQLPIILEELLPADEPEPRAQPERDTLGVDRKRRAPEPEPEPEPEPQPEPEPEPEPEPARGRMNM